MTTIIYKGQRLYVDSRAYSGGKTPVGSKTKLHFLEEGIYAGSSTVIGAAEHLFSILKEHGVHHTVSEDVDVDALYVTNAGEIYYFGGGSRWTTLDPDQHVAIGSGAQYALGALAAGADGETAMHITCQLDVWSSLPIRSARIGAHTT